VSLFWLKLGTPAGGDEPRGFREGLRAFTDKDTPVVGEMTGSWNNYDGAKPPIFLSVVFLGVMFVVGLGLYGVVAALPSWTFVGPLFIFALFGACAFFCFFPLRRIWRAALRARVAAKR
jgi:hypothetical protein